PLVAPSLMCDSRTDRLRPRSATVKLGRAFLEEGRRAFLLVLRSGAQSEVGSFEGETFGLARFHSLVDGVERISDGQRRVTDDLFQDRFRTGDQIGGRDDFVDQSDTVG